MENRSTLYFCGLVAVVFLIAISCNNSNAQDKKRSGIRSIDFLNFTYDSSLCSKEYGADGIGRSVRLKKGEFKAHKGTDEEDYAYFGIVNDKVLYGDVTNDGNEEAIIHIACGMSRANFGLNEIFVYTLRNGIPFLLARITDNDIERDYKRYYRSSRDHLWPSVNSIKIEKGNLVIEKLSEGSHANPEHITKITYRWNGSAFQPVKKPERKKSAP